MPERGLLSVTSSLPSRQTFSCAFLRVARTWAWKQLRPLVGTGEQMAKWDENVAFDE